MFADPQDQVVITILVFVLYVHDASISQSVHLHVQVHSLLVLLKDIHSVAHAVQKKYDNQGWLLLLGVDKVLLIVQHCQFIAYIFAKDI